MKIFRIAFLSICIAGLSGCHEGFNDLPVDFSEIEVVVTDSVSVLQYVAAIYKELPDGYNRIQNTAMIGCATDEAIHSAPGGTYIDRMAKGAWGPSFNPDDAWANAYRGIRKTNDYFINVVPLISDKIFSAKSRVELLNGQVYFLRAFYYFELLKRYGGVPIITEVLTADEEINFERNTYDECLTYILQQCDSAYKYVPEVYPGENRNDYGRATKGAVLALKSRALLYAASPLFNDPANSEDTYEHGAYSPEKWKKSAEASAEILNSGVYELIKPYKNIFISLAGNPEIIFSKMESTSNRVEQANGPTGFTGGAGGTGPSLNLADKFRMKNGDPFDWNNPEHAANPFENREERFEQIILGNGIEWMGRNVETFEGGLDMLSVNSTKTGMYLRKFLDPIAKWFGSGQGATFHCFPIFRIGEIYLNYAEAMNEAYGPDADPEEYGLTASEALRWIYLRGGLRTKIPSGITREELRVLIQDERQIELAFEEHRHFDVRRWKTAGEVLNQPIRGLKITKEEDGTLKYEPQIVEERYFNPNNMYLYPIPQREINYNSALVQNTGW
jgi:hypothetical protein